MSSIICPNCGYSNPAENKFCEQCGAQLQSPQPTTQPPTGTQSPVGAQAPSEGQTYYSGTPIEQQSSYRTRNFWGAFFIGILKIPVIILTWFAQICMTACFSAICEATLEDKD